MAIPSTRQSFLIVGTQRTGSSALGEALGQHPRIFCGWEWTETVPPWGRIAVASRALGGDYSVLSEHNRRHVLGGMSPEKSVVGFRRLFRSSNKWLLHPRWAPALWLDRLEGHLRWLATRPDIRVVHILRSDNLAWLKSKALSAATGQYFGSAYASEARATIPVGEALRRLRAKAWVDRRLSRLRRTNPYMEVLYEDFRADNRRQACRVVSFLGCDPAELPALEMRAKPQSGAGTDAQIPNLEALRKSLAEHGLLQAAGSASG